MPQALHALQCPLEGLPATAWQGITLMQREPKPGW